MHMLEAADLNSLFTALRERDYTIVGPTVRDGAIVLDVIERPEQLPRGWRDVQEPGTYRLEKREDEAMFGFVVGPYSWKRFLYPPRLRLFAATKAGKGFEVVHPTNGAVPKYAFFGVRPCEIAAIKLQDRIFLNGPYADQHYGAVRKAACIIAVNCVEPGGTCFCASMGTGPRAEKGYDLVLTEMTGGGHARFLLDAGSVTGNELLGAIHAHEAGDEDRAAVDHVLQEAAKGMGRSMDVSNIQTLFRDTFEHARWDEIAKRCLSCANCTLVCPTCFCSSVEDTTDLTGSRAERWRRWDSCFTSDFTKIAGGNIRMSTRTRYRQWLTHKLANWIDQFGTSGCVGCGRCITWCPAGIDLTAEIAALRKEIIA